MKLFSKLFQTTLVLAMIGVLPAMAADPIRIMPIGDSITAGYTDNRDGWTEPFAFGYRAPLYTRLANAGYDFTFVGGSTEPWLHETAPTAEQVYNGLDLRDVGQDNHRGYGGKDAGYLSGNINNWLTVDDPDVILLMIGINDISQYSTGTPTTVQNSLNTLVNQIVTAKPEANLIVAQITPYAHYTDSIVQYNNYIANTLVPNYANAGYNVTTVNQYDNLLTDGVIDPTLFSNGINHENATSYDRMAQTWFEGIEALNYPTNPTTAPGEVFNGGFENPTYADSTHSYGDGIAGSGWTSTGRAGIDNGNPYGMQVLNSTAYEGSQMGFLQGDSGNTVCPSPDGVSSLSQDITGLTNGETYTLSFQAKGMNGFDGMNPFSVSFGGTDLSFDGETLLTPCIGYETFISAPIIASAETMNLKFYDEGNIPGQQVSWIDDIQLTLGVYTPPVDTAIVKNGSFELSPILAGDVHDYSTSVTRSTGWNHEGRSGIGHGNPFGYSENCAPFVGEQMAFLQGDDGNTVTPADDGVSKLGQEVSGFEAGHLYTLSFAAMGMDAYGGANPFYVSIDGEDLFGLITPGTEYEEYLSDPFLATGETMDLLFYDQGNVTGQKITWIDAVEITEYEALAGDANLDGKVDGSDVTILANNWQRGVNGSDDDVTWLMGDFNLDGKVDGSDVTILANNWQQGVDNTTTASVPEPSMMVLVMLALGWFAVARVRR